ncbi:hypothetical protein OSTOST_20970 [Ostertagia ostertagi]
MAPPFTHSWFPAPGPFKAQPQRVVVTTRSHLSQSVIDALNALKEKGLVDVIEKYGGAGYKAQLTDISGRFLSYESSVQRNNTGGVLASAPWVNHQEYIGSIPKVLKDQLPEIVAKS